MAPATGLEPVTVRSLVQAQSQELPRPSLRRGFFVSRLSANEDGVVHECVRGYAKEISGANQVCD